MLDAPYTPSFGVRPTELPPVEEDANHLVERQAWERGDVVFGAS